MRAHSETQSAAWHGLDLNYLKNKEVEIMRLFHSENILLSCNDIARSLKCRPSDITSTIASLVSKKLLDRRAKAKDKFTNITNVQFGKPVPVQLSLLELA